MTRTLSQELFHYVKEHNWNDGQNLQDFALEMLKQTEGYNLEERVKQKIEQYARNGIELTEEEALEEIAADSMLTVLQNEQLLEQILEEEPTLFEKLKNFIHSLIEELKRMAAGLKNPEARAMLKQEQEMLDMLAAMFDAVAIKAKENAARTDGDAGEVAFSVKREEWDEESKAFYKQFPSSGLKFKNISEYSAEELNRVKGYLSSVDEGLLEFAKKIQNGEAKPSDKYQMGLVPEKLMKKN